MKYNNVRQVSIKSLIYKLMVIACIFSVSATIMPEQTVLAAQSEQNFSDVSMNLYSYEAIRWAKNNGIINGYTDKNGKENGKFGPNDTVTEAQFVKMLVIFFNLKDDQGNVTKSTGVSHWSDTYYDALAKHGVPLSGYFDNTVRMTPIQRGNVAQAIGYLVADHQSLEHSIQFMLETGITQGQNPQFENIDINDFFGSTNHLTRAQAVTFLHRLHMEQFTQLAKGANETARDEASIDAKASKAVDKLIVKVDSSTNKYSGFFGTEDEEVAKVKATEQPPSAKVGSFFDSLGPIKLPESTPLSRDIASKLGKNKLGFEFVGYDDYLVDARIDGKTVFGISYNKKVPIDLQDDGDITVSFIKGDTFYKLEQYQHNIESLLKYTGLPKQEIDTIMKEFKVMYNKDVVTLKDSITNTGYYTEYKFLLNRKVLISYEFDLVFIVLSHNGPLFE